MTAPHTRPPDPTSRLTATARDLKHARSALSAAVRMLTMDAPPRLIRTWPANSLYWGITQHATGRHPERLELVAELAHAAIRAELLERYPDRSVHGGLIRLAEEGGPEALVEIFETARVRLRSRARS